MAYDAAKAHEYYVNYTKKGLKKGRKKGKGTTAKTSTLLGSNAYGLNDDGRVQAALIKEKIKKEMNEALKGAGSDEEKEKIRVEYSKKAMQQIAALRNDPKYAKPKATKTSSSKGSKSSKSSGTSSKSSSSSSSSSKATTKTKTASADDASVVSKQLVSSLTTRAEKLISVAKTLPPEMKEKVAQTVEGIIEQLKLLRGE